LWLPLGGHKGRPYSAIFGPFRGKHPELKEQTGNVDENKEPSQEVEQSRSQEVQESNPRANSTGSLSVSVNSSTLDPQN
jgi:hypothetical protein